MSMNPRYPIYIISKGRWESRNTARALDRIRVPYRIVVEPQEREQYESVIDPDKVLILPFSNLGQGSIPARNWVWEHSIQEGHERHWILDDNMNAFYRLNRNLKVKVTSGVPFRVTEDLVDRYTNVPMAGLQYEHLVPRRMKRPPFTANTRIYSCILLANSIHHRWRGRYNEDTDLSLRILKDGLCTILIQAFLCDKIATMRMSGGNTDQLYEQSGKFDGRWEMAESLRRQHPDVTKIVRKWGRWQHQVDYRRFKRNKLKRRPDVVIPEGVNNYGMKLVDKATGKPIEVSG
jgi:hypothetical protein